MDWNKFAKDVHQVAVDKGWWDKPRSFNDVICMCICELAEAVEEYRNGRPNYYHLCVASGDKRNPCDWDLGKPCPLSTGELACEHRDPKPEGVAVELADCVLRILDYLATTDEDISMEVGSIPETDYGPTINVPALFCDCSRHLVYAHINTGSSRAVALNLIMCIKAILGWCDQHKVPSESILREKHEYNKTRPYRHGGKVL